VQLVFFCYSIGGVKCRKAFEWNVPVVGINWLNDVILGELNALKLPINPCYLVQNNQAHRTAKDLFRIDTSKVSYLLGMNFICNFI